MAGGTILFVYNAESGIAAGLMDSIHKLVSPATYPCDLCAITYGPVGMRAAWRVYLRTLALPMRFLHRADFLAEWPDADIVLPAILLDTDGRLEALVDAARMRGIARVDDLAAALDAALSAPRSAAPPPA